MASGTKSDLLSGLKNRSPTSDDSSTKLPKGPSVDSEATRKETAPNADTLGPRVA